MKNNINGKILCFAFIFISIAGCDNSKEAEALYHAGKEAFESREIENAVELYTQASELGSTSAQLELADMYLRGRGVPQDTKKAISWFELAGTSGNEKALGNLVDYYMSIYEMEEAEKWALIGAQKGIVRLQIYLGNGYATGLIFSDMHQDYDLAMKWYIEAARQKSMEAYTQIIKLYSTYKNDNVELYAWAYLKAELGDSQTKDYLFRTLPAEQVKAGVERAKTLKKLLK